MRFGGLMESVSAEGSTMAAYGHIAELSFLLQPSPLYGARSGVKWNR